jgi:hypothetical protein
MKYNGKTIIAKADAGTYDIIEALINISPKGIDQVKEEVKNLNLTGNAVKDALLVGNYIRKNVKYKSDGYKDQNIQLPGRMFNGTKQADCKSFSLAFFSLMSAAGHNVGYRFASYRKNKIPTHVYNWFFDNDKNFYTFDTCVKDFKESKRHTFIKDMQVNYLTGLDESGIYGKKERQERREARKQKREERRKEGKGFFQGVKKIALAVPRRSFRTMVALNIRSLATKLDQAIAKDENKVKELWSKFGGKFDKLQQSINAGKNKKPLFGKGKGVNGIEQFDYVDENGYFIGAAGVDDAAVAAAIAAAAPILVVVANLFKSMKIKKGEGEDIITPEEEKEAEDSGSKITDPNFKAEDDENEGSSSSMSFKPSPMLIGGLVGAAALVYFLTKKKR